MTTQVRSLRFSTSHLRYSICKPTTITTIVHHHHHQHYNALLYLRLPSSTRAFHATPNPRVLSSLLTTTHTALTTLHTSTLLPWALIIPLSALLLRLVVTMPLTILTRRAVQQRLVLQPLLQAWSHHARRQNMRKSNSLGPAVVFREVEKDVRKKRRELYARWGCQLWKTLLPVGQLPVWLLMVETFRGMVGMEKGLLRLMEEQLAGLWSWMRMAGAGTADAGELRVEIGPELAAEEMAEGLSRMEILGQKDIVVEAVPFEPSMTAEGMLWFPDLTVADPTMSLSLMLTSVMLLNIYSGTRKSIPGLGVSKWKQRLTRMLTVVALAAFPLTLQMPSAMVLYWVSSGMWAYGQNLLLDHYMPMKPPIKPCGDRQRSAKQ